MALATATETAPKRLNKKRKATHAIRREEKLTLENKVAELEAALAEIKCRALLSQGHAAESCRETAVENAVLRECIQDHHMAIAHVQALVCGPPLHDASGVRPMEAKICLSADRVERRRVLHGLRRAKLRRVKGFLHERSYGMKTNTSCFQEERYESVEGDYFITRFEITPLRGVQGGVRAVFEAVLQAAVNIEIIISETSGNITVREDDDMYDDSVSQMRLVSETKQGVLVENNLVHFSEYLQGKCGSDGDGDYAVSALDFVDEDMLYPYRPLERIRRDATTAMLLTSYREPRSTRGREQSKNEGEVVVVVTRWSRVRICHTEMDVSRKVLQELRANCVRSQDTFMNCVQEALGLSVDTA
ncbi:unnamed protein product [Hyaloperonospora brassicae]|uniref:Uncharacterized protein n=1 Tax=Hyaloperonospora brassicae TaxID=162125 RepID=A0AAV0UU29_HYABA|nr:unnamed protein product [Hyaloperonospora brassicae]